MDAVRVSVYQGATPFGEWWEGFLLPIRATLWGLESAEGYSVSIGPSASNPLTGRGASSARASAH